MILEIADIHITPGQQAAFDEAIVRGLTTVASKAKGFRGWKVNHGVESPERYLLMIFWDTLEAQGASAQGLQTALHYADNLDTPRNNAFRKNFALTFKANADVYAVQGYDAAQLLGAGLVAVKGDFTKRDGMIAAMRKTTVDSPRGKFTLSPSHNPVQDMFLREAVGKNNEFKGVAVKALADPGRGCRM